VGIRFFVDSTGFYRFLSFDIFIHRSLLWLLFILLLQCYYIVLCMLLYCIVICLIILSRLCVMSIDASSSARCGKQCCKIPGINLTMELFAHAWTSVIDHMIDVGIHVFKFNIRLDPYADIGALTLSADWIMRCFNVAFSCYLYPHHLFFTNQRSVSKRQCLHKDPA